MPSELTANPPQIVVNAQTVNFTNNVHINKIVENFFPDIGENENHPARKLKEKQIAFLQAYREHLQKATTLQSIPPHLYPSLPKISTILKSVCMITWRELDQTSSELNQFVGTGFLGKLNNGYGTPSNIAFMSAGHNFDDILKQNMDPTCLTKFKIYFGNLSGDILKDDFWSKYMSKWEELHKLLEPFSFCGSISNNGKRVLFQNGKLVHYEQRIGDLAVKEDYCMLQLNGDITQVEQALKKKGLEALPIGRGAYLETKHGELVSIFGHPGGGGQTNASNDPNWTPGVVEDGKFPLRISFGTEKDLSKQNKAPSFMAREQLTFDQMKNYLFYDNDTFPGNSGSPVIGRAGNGQGYNVKGIHVRSFNEYKTNGAQKIVKYQEWIDAGKNFTPTN